jgi:Helix-turn-helix domain
MNRHLNLPQQLELIEGGPRIRRPSLIASAGARIAPAVPVLFIWETGKGNNDELKTPKQAAEFLQCSPKQVHAHAKNGELRYVDVGCGDKRPVRRFTEADLIDFAERRSRREASQCQSTGTKARRTGTTTSSAMVYDFTALREQVIAAKRSR